jgi:predicted phage tail component-like protein
MWFEFNGIRSDDYDIVAEYFPLVPVPIRNVTSIEIPGMDGSLTQSDDTYGDMNYPIQVRATDDCPFELIQSWLNGSGDLIVSDDPSKKYKARFDSRSLNEDFFSCFRVTFNFIVSPFKYEAEPETIELTASGTVYNIGTRKSYPIITVYGAGDLTIGSYSLTIAATGGESYVIINSEIQECYYDTSTSRNNKVTGDFPEIDPGECAVTIGAGITQVDIQGNWRWF